MHRWGLSRRGFLARSLAALGATGVPAWFGNEVLALTEESAARQNRPGANGRLGIGLIGSGDRSKQVIRPLLKNPAVEIVQICDADLSHLADVAGLIKKETGKDVKTTTDYRVVCDNKDIQAVLVITPDHWHTLPCIAAAKAKKDIYVEKPLTLTVAEGWPLIKAVRSQKVVLQVGSQQRSEMGGRFRLACELVRNGRVGKLHTIETRIGGAPRGGPFKETEPPKELNWDLWQGQTPAVPYIKERCHYQFRWWYEYSGGKGTDWGAHHNDIAQWALDMDHSGPVTIESKGEAPNIPNGFNCHTKFEITFTYANGVKVICDSRDGKENGVKFNGDKGWIFVSRSLITASDPKIIDEPLPKDAVRLYPSTNHMQNFLDCVASRKDPTCTVEIGHRSVSVCHLGNISLRLGGRKFNWDPKAEKADDPDAQRMLSREQRPPYRIEG